MNSSKMTKYYLLMGSSHDMATHVDANGFCIMLFVFCLPRNEPFVSSAVDAFLLGIRDMKHELSSNVKRNKHASKSR